MAETEQRNHEAAQALQQQAERERERERERQSERKREMERQRERERERERERAIDWSMVPQVITVSGARTKEGHGRWPNDTWHLSGEHAGKPQWYRKGNPRDFIKWDGRRWTLNGMQPKCYFQHKQDSALPPQTGWQSAEMGVSAMPVLSYDGTSDANEDYRTMARSSIADSYSTCSHATLRLVDKGSSTSCKLRRKLSSNKSQLVLDNGMAIGPKWDQTRNAWGQWAYIDLGVGELNADSIEVCLSACICA